MPRPLTSVGLLAAAVLAAVAFAVFGLDAEGLTAAAGSAVLVAVSVTDLRSRRIPNRIVVPALAAALVVQTLRDPGVEHVGAAALAGGFLLAAALAHPAGMGMGDVKLAAFLGAWLGWPVVVALFAGMLASLVPAVAILVLRGAAGRKVGLPFAPFLALGALVALYAGEALIDRWLAL